MEDFVDYKLYHPQHLNVSRDSPNEYQQFIEFGHSLVSCVSQLCDDYLWRKDCFHIEPQWSDARNAAAPKGARLEQTDSQHLSHFKGTVYYGGDVSDEWVIVYLLYKLSQNFPNLVIEVCDNDGQFLLIHCAYDLPHWLEPQNVRNRVYIHRHQLHVIPLLHDVMNGKRKSIELVSNASIDTLADENIQRSIHAKLSQIAQTVLSANHPAASSAGPGINRHSMLVVLPKRCALLVQKHPFMISHIIDAYLQHCSESNDIKHRKSVKIKQRKFEITSSAELVFVSVRVSRYLYAALSTKVLQSAPIYFRKQKFDFNQYRSHNHKQMHAQSSRQTRVIQQAFMNGIKLMIGLEALYDKCQQNIADDSMDKEWMNFKQSLIKKGYFEDCVPNSTDFVDKERGAKQYYEQHMKPKTDQAQSSSIDHLRLCVANGVHPMQVPSFCVKAMDDAIACGAGDDGDEHDHDWIEVYQQEYKANETEEKNESAFLEKLKYDDDEWMNVTDAEVNSLLNEYAYFDVDKQQQLFEEMLDDDDDDEDDEDHEEPADGDAKTKQRQKQTEVAQQSKDDVLSLRESMNTFMTQQSEFDGVEVQRNDDDDDADIDTELDAEKILKILQTETADSQNTNLQEMKDVMQTMDNELLNKQKVKKNIDKEVDGECETAASEDENELWNDDVDLNMVNDILQSHQLSSQSGGAGLGPAATLLSQLGYTMTN